MTTIDDKGAFREALFAKLEEIRGMIYAYVDAAGWHDLKDNDFVSLKEFRDLLDLNLLYCNCSWLEEIAKDRL